MSTPTRDRALERSFLAPAGEVSPDFASRVITRLDQAGEHLDRDTPDHLTIADVLAEAREECLDIGGWGAQALHLAAHRLQPHQVAMLRARLNTAVTLAALADHILEQSSRSLSS